MATHLFELPTIYHNHRTHHIGVMSFRQEARRSRSQTQSNTNKGGSVNNSDVLSIPQMPHEPSARASVETGKAKGKDPEYNAVRRPPQANMPGRKRYSGGVKAKKRLGTSLLDRIKGIFRSS
ncbi:hypothetical protein D9619_010228 [Psilocybe cf. subviscida]|uniref:Uncharacterized protein n=1 Tax=Psilocybe cf. subviscida TaxID=2480587 RepID=A0A8H5AS76_9AGAR|nr:hypothetical protein D9619_010228 [Psilocybe cf. subviscida]